MKIEEILNGYIIYLRNIRRYSPNTIKAYNADLNDFINYCKDNNRTDSSEINERFIKSYLMSLSEKKIEKISIVRKLSSLRGLFTFAFKQDLIKQNPTSQVRNPKTSKKLPEITSAENIVKTFDLADEADENPTLIKAIFELLYGCSLRVSEVCNIKVGDVDFDKNSIRVLGKGSKTRIVPIGSQSKINLKEYLNSVPFGEDVYGIEAAANRYFNKTVAELDIEEAAMLVGLLKGNTYYNPRLHPNRRKYRPDSAPTGQWCR